MHLASLPSPCYSYGKCVYAYSGVKPTLEGTHREVMRFTRLLLYFSCDDYFYPFFFFLRQYRTCLALNKIDSAGTALHCDAFA